MGNEQIVESQSTHQPVIRQRCKSTTTTLNLSIEEPPETESEISSSCNLSGHHNPHCYKKSLLSVSESVDPFIPFTPSPNSDNHLNNDIPFSFDSIATRQSFVKKRASMFKSMNIENGITGKYVSQRLVSIAAGFWLKNIESLGMEVKLEIGCSIFFGMLSSNKEMKQIMQNNLSTGIKLETTSLKYLDMIGWLMRSLVRDNINLYSLLTKLGYLHNKMGIKVNHFEIMIVSLHETMAYYFPKQYDLDVQYAMDEIITCSAQIMTGNLTRDRIKSFHGSNTPFLRSLEVCLSSEIGTEYFYRYLEQHFCKELKIYLVLLQKFKNETSAQQRYIVINDIINTCIKPKGCHAINISYETREKSLKDFKRLEQKWINQRRIKISDDYFKDVEIEMRRLIIKNHWFKFVNSVGELHNSANVEHLTID